MKKKNILMIYTDEQRPDSLGCYSGWAKTPVLDRLAGEATVFHECHVPSPVCVPCRTSTFFSRSPQATGVYDNRYFFEDGILPEGLKSFPQLFSENGYTTASIGKWHTPNNPTWDENIFWQHFDTVGCYVYKDGISEKAHKVVKRPKGDAIIMAGIYPDDRWGTDPASHLFDMAVDWLKAHAEDEDPFFLRISPLWPHTPVSTPSPWHKLYDPGEIPLEVKDRDMYANRSAHDVRLSDGQGGMQMSDETWDWVHRCYYGLCSYVDHQVGRVLFQLEEMGLMDDTIIVYTSDHGKSMGEYGACEKGAFDREVWRVPLIIRNPDEPIPRNNHAICSTLDLGKTLLDLCGIEQEAGMEGRNLLKDPSPEITFGIINMGGIRDVSNPHKPENFGTLRLAVRKGSWRYDFTYSIGGKELTYAQCDESLFNVQDDPDEKNNLNNESKLSQLCKELWQLGVDWHKEGVKAFESIE